jgi:catechol 1,2-dioxygenase
MKRRTFIKDAGTGFVSLALLRGLTPGYVQLPSIAQTTTDILGPFYRPGAPMRSNILPEGFAGETLNVSGTIFRDDGRTPFKDCLVEVWQCDPKQLYDNTSDEFRFRGAQKPANGKYHFVTTRPVAYPAEPGSSQLRPAHIHFRISGEKQQDLITQIYLAGDPNIPIDPCASSPDAAGRIVGITKGKNGEGSITFDVVMAKEFIPDDSVFNKLTGLYTMSDRSILEFYREGDLLFVKWNGQIREGLGYKGDNTFVGGLSHTARFELLPNGEVKVKLHWIRVVPGSEQNLEGVKSFKY